MIQTSQLPTIEDVFSNMKTGKLQQFAADFQDASQGPVTLCRDSDY